MSEYRKPNISAEFQSPLDQDEWKEIARRLRLTPRQKDVVELILRGMRDKQIATALGLSVRTVREHLSHLFARLEARDRIGLVLRIFALARRK
jgi:DNA-binding NarL/FixJ family response regulator